jgi:hypothetical protein
MSHHNVTKQSNGVVDFFERLNYFFGKLLTVRDFRAEQSYFNEKRWMLNRFTTGWGVVCGLEVKKMENTPPQVVVMPGLAIDLYGNEIFVGKEVVIDLVKIPPPPSPTPPAPIQECNGTENDCYYSRIKETYEINYFAEDDLPEDLVAQNGETSDHCTELVPEFCDDFVNPCPPRPKCQWLLLAKVICEISDNGDVQIIRIENRHHRKFIWSNEFLAHCLTENIRTARSARVDRRQFVPLLAQTISGVKHRKGRILTITDQWEESTPGKVKLDVGVEPFAITTDGDHIWFTDRDSDTNSVLKMPRKGNRVEKLQVNKKSWGIAFDGCYLWVTHHEDNCVSKIPKSATATTPLDPLPDIEIPTPRDIIFAEGYVWVARPGGVTRIDVISDNIDETRDLFELGFDPIAMAFDGDHIWMVYSGDGEMGEINKIDLEGNLILEKPIYLRDDMQSDYPTSLVFDGTHLWVTTQDGVTQIDINENETEKKVMADNTLTGAAFDGFYLWMGEPDGKKIHRVDIFARAQVSEFRPTEDLEGNRHFAKMCFDGIFIWVTDYSDSGENKVGVIHRLLV